MLSSAWLASYVGRSEVHQQPQFSPFFLSFFCLVWLPHSPPSLSFFKVTQHTWLKVRSSRFLLFNGSIHPLSGEVAPFTDTKSKKSKKKKNQKRKKAKTDTNAFDLHQKGKKVVDIAQTVATQPRQLHYLQQFIKKRTKRPMVVPAGLMLTLGEGGKKRTDGKKKKKKRKKKFPSGKGSRVFAYLHEKKFSPKS